MNKKRLDRLQLVMKNTDNDNAPMILGYFLENHIDEVRYMMPFLGGQELMFALASSSCLAQVQLGQTVEEAGTVPAQRKSTYLGSAVLTEHAVRSGLLQPSKALMGLAARHGCLEGMQVLRVLDPPCPWNKQTCARAAEGGHLEMLQWMRAQTPPCPWNEATCWNAAEGGYLEVLQWVRAQTPPCPWNKETCMNAAEGGHLELLKWAIDNGCPEDEGEEGYY